MNNELIDQLPIELWCHEILTFLTAKDVVRVGLTCKHLHCASLNNELWRVFVESDWMNMNQINGTQSTAWVSVESFDESNPTDDDTDGADHIELLIHHNEQEDLDYEENYRELYANRALQYFTWKSSLYSTRSRLSAHETEDWRNSAVELVHLFITYLRILTWMFVSPKVQPSFIPIHEMQRIKTRALDAGSYLIASLMFLPLLISGTIIYFDAMPYPLINAVVQGFLLFSWIILIKYGSITTKVNVFSDQGVMQMRVARLTMCAAFLVCVLIDDLVLSNVMIAILSIDLAISKSLEPMVSYSGGDNDLAATTNANQNLVLNYQERLFHGNSLISATLNGVLFAAVMGIGGIKFTLAVFLIAVFVILGASPIGILQFLGLLSPSRALVSLGSGVISFLLFYLTKWCLLSGGFPNRHRMQKIVCWIILAILALTHVILLYRITAIIAFGSARISIADDSDVSIGNNTTVPAPPDFG